MNFDMYKYRVFAIFVALFCAASMANAKGSRRFTDRIRSGLRESLVQTRSYGPEFEEFIQGDESYQDGGNGLPREEYSLPDKKDGAPDANDDVSDRGADWSGEEMEHNSDADVENQKADKESFRSSKSSDTDDNPEDSGLDFGSFLLILMLAIGGWLAYKNRAGLKKFIHPMPLKNVPRSSAPPVPPSQRPSDMKILQEKIDILTREKLVLQNELDGVRRENQRLAAELARISPKPSPIPTPSPVPHPQTTILYAQAVVSNAFLESGIKNAMNDYTIAIIQLKSPNEGEFRINDQSSVQPMLINNFAFGVKLVSSVRNKNLTPSRIDTIEKGIVKKQGDRWVVVKPALVDLV